MLTINLLPTGERTRVRAEELSRIVRFFGSALILLFIVASVFLSPSFLPMIFERRELERSLALIEGRAENTKSREILANARAVSKTLLEVGSAFERRARASAVFSMFSDELPSGIEVSNLTVKENGDVVVNGRAATRREILQFEDALRKSERFESLVTPLSNIIRNTDIPFTIQGTLKSEFRLTN